MPARVLSREDWSISTALCLCRPFTVGEKGACVLGVGVDWAESFHDVALGVPGRG